MAKGAYNQKGMAASLNRCLGNSGFFACSAQSKAVQIVRPGQMLVLGYDRNRINYSAYCTAPAAGYTQDRPLVAQDKTQLRVYELVKRIG